MLGCCLVLVSPARFLISRIGPPKCMDVEKAGEQDTTDMAIWVDASQLARIWILGTGRKGQTATSHLEINSWRCEAEWTTPKFLQGPDRSYACVIIDFVTGGDRRRGRLSFFFSL